MEKLSEKFQNHFLNFLNWGVIINWNARQKIENPEIAPPPPPTITIGRVDQLEKSLTTYIIYITNKLLPSYNPNFENKGADTYMGVKKKFPAGRGVYPPPTPPLGKTLA